jgi:hypothetical protein
MSRGIFQHGSFGFFHWVKGRKLEKDSRETHSDAGTPAYWWEPLLDFDYKVLKLTVLFARNEPVACRFEPPVNFPLKKTTFSAIHYTSAQYSTWMN